MYHIVLLNCYPFDFLKLLEAIPLVSLTQYQPCVQTTPDYFSLHFLFFCLF